jgi:hypothetical protein
MSLELSPEIEQVVRERATAEGVSVNDLLARTFAPEMADVRPPNDPIAHVRALLAGWQASDHTPSLPQAPPRSGETPTEALFRMWEEEDAHLTDKEVESEEQLWEAFQQGINATRSEQGMRRLF